MTQIEVDKIYKFSVEEKQSLIIHREKIYEKIVYISCEGVFGGFVNLYFHRNFKKPYSCVVGKVKKIISLDHGSIINLYDDENLRFLL